MLYRILVLLSIHACDVVSTQCYWINGAQATSDFQPCNSNVAAGSQSYCCNLGKSPADTCLGSGLCQRQDAGSSDYLIYAVGCTDPTGKNANCPQYCAGLSAEIYSLQLCQDGLWCCNDQSVTTCCNNGIGSFAFNLLSLAPNSSSTTTTSTTITNYVTSNATNATDHKNKTTVAAASIGAVLGALLVASLVSLLLVTRRLQRVKKELYVNKGLSAERNGSERPEFRAEMDATTTPSGLMGDRITKYELDGR